MPLVLLAALLGAAPSARAGVGRAVEVALPGEAPSLKTGSSPAVTLQLPPVGALAAPGLSPALAAPLAPALQAPAPLAPAAAVRPAALQAAALPAAAKPAAPIDALRRTGAALSKAAPASDGAAAEVSALFDGSGAKAAGADGVSASPSSSRAPALAPSTPRPSRRMPDGVKRAFQNSAVLGGGMAALSAALYAWTQSLASAPSPALFAVLAAPLLLVPFHFALVSGFWAGRYYAYPKLSPAAKNAFVAAWRAAAIAYPVAALALVAAWLQVIGGNPAVLGVMGLPALVALGEVTHHFIYRVVPERAQDKGKALTDWRDRLGGNIGQQLKRMRRKP